uniref:glucuronosyltransferase n=1 Tax=Ditylenchus dipsaci TaxID=166011 RepID=A0A915EE28_9BILA
MLDTSIWRRTSNALEPLMITHSNDMALGNFTQTYSSQMRDLLNQDWDLLVLDSLFNSMALLLRPTLFLPSDVWARGLGGSWSAQQSMFTAIPQDSQDLFDQKFGHTFCCRFHKLHAGSSALLSDGFWDLVISLQERRILGMLEHIVTKQKHLTRRKKICRRHQFQRNHLHSSRQLYNMEQISISHNISFKGKNNQKVGSHVKLVSWAPQFDLLSHPKTVMFLTHGGLKSIKEGICSRKPFVFFPLFAEQARNSRVAVGLGLGTVINKYSVTQQLLENSIKQTIENSSYTLNMKKYYDKFMDLPIPPLDEAKMSLKEYCEKRTKLEAGRKACTSGFAGKILRL